jgi:predicted CopG family antitoxin
MARTIELDDDLADRLADHCREDESLEEFIEELVTIYEHEGRFTDEGL